MKQNLTKRLLAFFLSIVMLFGSIPVSGFTAFAETLDTEKVIEEPAANTSDTEEVAKENLDEGKVSKEEKITPVITDQGSPKGFALTSGFQASSATNPNFIYEVNKVTGVYTTDGKIGAKDLYDAMNQIVLQSGKAGASEYYWTSTQTSLLNVSNLLNGPFSSNSVNTDKVTIVGDLDSTFYIRKKSTESYWTEIIGSFVVENKATTQWFVDTEDPIDIYDENYLESEIFAHLTLKSYSPTIQRYYDDITKEEIENDNVSITPSEGGTVKVQYKGNPDKHYLPSEITVPYTILEENTKCSVTTKIIGDQNFGKITIEGVQSGQLKVENGMHITVAPNDYYIVKEINVFDCTESKALDTSTKWGKELNIDAKGLQGGHQYRVDVTVAYAAIPLGTTTDRVESNFSNLDTIKQQIWYSVKDLLPDSYDMSDATFEYYNGRANVALDSNKSTSGRHKFGTQSEENISITCKNTSIFSKNKTLTIEGNVFVGTTDKFIIKLDNSEGATLTIDGSTESKSFSPGSEFTITVSGVDDGYIFNGIRLTGPNGYTKEIEDRNLTLLNNETEAFLSGGVYTAKTILDEIKAEIPSDIDVNMFYVNEAKLQESTPGSGEYLYLVKEEILSQVEEAKTPSDFFQGAEVEIKYLAFKLGNIEIWWDLNHDFNLLDGLAHTFGYKGALTATDFKGNTETVRIVYSNDGYQKTLTTKVHFKDTRTPTIITGKRFDTIYDNNADNFKGKVLKHITLTDEEGEKIELTDDEFKILISVSPEIPNVKLLQRQDVTVRFEGNETYKPSETPVSVYVWQRGSFIKVPNTNKFYDGDEDYELNISCTPGDLNYIRTIVGVDANARTADKPKALAEGFVSISFPKSLKDKLDVDLYDFVEPFFPNMPSTDNIKQFADSIGFGDLAEKIFGGINLEEDIEPAKREFVDGIIDTIRSTAKTLFNIDIPGEGSRIDLYQFIVGRVNDAATVDELSSISDNIKNILSIKVWGETTLGELIGIPTDILEFVLNQIKNIDGITPKTKVFLEKLPTDVGLYLVTAVSADLNYTLSMDSGFLTIAPETKDVSLTYKEDMETTALSEIITNYPYFAEAVNKLKENKIIDQLDSRVRYLAYDDAQCFDFGGKLLIGEEPKEEAQRYVEAFYSGVTFTGRVVAQSEPIREPGIYVETITTIGGNYFAAPISRTYVIEKGRVGMTLKSDTVTYDGEHHSLKAEGEGISENKVIYTYTDIRGIKLSAPKDAGVYYVNATFLGDAIHRPAMKDAVLTILPRPVTVTVNPEAASKVYGAYDPAFGYTVEEATGEGDTGLIEGDRLTDIVTYREKGEDVGEYAVHAYENDILKIKNINYDIQFIPGTFKITPRPVTVTMDDATKVYGDEDPKFSYDISQGFWGTNEGLLPRDYGKLLLVRTYRNHPQKKDVGTYDEELTGNFDNALGNNYDVDLKEGSLTITPRPVSVYNIKALDKTYDGTRIAILNPLFAWINNKVRGDHLYVKPGVGFFVDKNAGEDQWVLIPTIKLGGRDAKNYEVKQLTSQHWTRADINPRKITVSITPNGGTYSGEITPAQAKLHGVVLLDRLTGKVPVTLCYNGESYSGQVYTASAEAPSEAGKYEVMASISNPNYRLIGKTKAPFEVKPYDISTEEAAAKVTLGDALIDNGTEQTQMVEGVKVTGAFGQDLDATFETENDTGSEAGIYTMKINGTMNYTGSIDQRFVVVPTPDSSNAKDMSDQEGNMILDEGKITVDIRTIGNPPEVSLLSHKFALIDMLVCEGKISADELVKISEGISDAEIIITVEDITGIITPESKNVLDKTVEGFKPGAYLNISMVLRKYDNGELVEEMPITEIPEAVTFGIVIPEGLRKDGRSYAMGRNDQGIGTALETKYNDSIYTLAMTTNRFSDYVLAYADPATTTSANTGITTAGLPIGVYVAIGFVVLAAALALVIVIRRRRQS